MIHFAILLMGGGFETLHLDELEIYQSNLFSINKVGDGYLISSDFDNRLCLVDSLGNEVVSYFRKGHGPNELFHQVVLGITDTAILVLSDERQVIHFNHKLEPQKKTFPPFPLRSWGGVNVKPNLFLVFSSKGAPSFGLTEMGLIRGEWKTMKKAFPIQLLRNHLPDRFLRYQNGFSFFFPGRIKDDTYKIEIHQSGSEAKEDLVQILAADVEELHNPSRNNFIFLETMAKDNGYWAHMEIVNKDYQFAKSYLDRFTEDGSFQGRREFDGKIKVICVYGGTEVFLLDREAMVLKRLHASK